MNKLLKSTIRLVVGIVISSIALSTTSTADYLNTVVTDGKKDFAEGVLKGYFLQVDGTLLCENPYVIGKYVSCRPALKIAGRVYKAPSKKVWVKTNGQLGGMSVIDSQGKQRCTDPVVSNMFRGPDSFVYCN